MQPKQLLALTTAALLVACALGYYFVFVPSQGPASDIATGTPYTLPDGTIIYLPPGATVGEAEGEQPAAIPAPNYRAALKIDASVSADLRTALEAKHRETVRLLDANKLDFNAWLNLAIWRKTGGDYRGAEEIWLYTAKQWPSSPVSWHNLADLYQNFLNDPAKAGAAFDKAAELEATQ